MDATNQANEKQPGEGGPEATASRLDRLRTYAKENPTTVLAAGAGAGLLFGVQFAMGAALGIGAALLLTKRTGPEMREQLQRRAREIFGQGGDLAEAWRRGKEAVGGRPGEEPPPGQGRPEDKS